MYLRSAYNQAEVVFPGGTKILDRTGAFELSVHGNATRPRDVLYRFTFEIK
jgi:hypothetical protein